MILDNFKYLKFKSLKTYKPKKIIKDPRKPHHVNILKFFHPLNDIDSVMFTVNSKVRVRTKPSKPNHPIFDSEDFKVDIEFNSAEYK